MSFLDCYKQFLSELEQISDEHDEVTDTDVRQRLRAVINYYFVWGLPIADDFPKRYALFSEQGDSRVYQAVHKFIVEAVAAAEQEGLSQGEARHKALENEDATTERFASYGEFLGSVEEVLPAEKPAADETCNYY
jgi:hypothetical protein